MNASEILNQRLNFSNYKYKFGGDGSDAGVTKHIDCSHLVHSMLVGAGYMIPHQTTADLCSSKYFDIIGADEAKPGDLILWRKVHQHVGVLESITPNADTNQPFGDFFGSQTSTGPASTKFGTDNKGLKHYWPIPDKFLRPKSCYYHGPGNTKSTDPIPRVPSKTSSHSKDKLEKAQQVREEIQEQWSMPSPVDQESDDGYATKMPANMGFFPVGTNLTWHGGIHCLGDSDHSVHCMFDGVVVAARLPEKDSAEPVHGSRNFVLVKHKTAQGDVFWSLYMHLQPIPLKDHDAKMLKALPWLYELELCSEGRGESNFRPLPSTGAYFNPPRTILPGEMFVLIDEHEADGFHWCHVQSKRDGIKGWVAKTSRIRISPVIHRGDSLRAGEVVHFDHPIQAGACLGFVSSPNSQQAPFVHVEIFSETLLSGGWTAVCDRDEDDVVCDAEGLKQLMNCAEDVQFLEPLTAGLIRETYADQTARARIWARAYQFKSEWSVDWEDALKRYDPEIARRQGPQFNLYRFWSEAESAGCDLPKGGKPYHYQPLVFREVMFPSSMLEPLPLLAKPDEFDIDWEFITKLEGCRADVYVPAKSGIVIGKSGPTVGSGFDLGQIDLSGFDSYLFSDSIRVKLKKYVNMRGSVALAFVKANKCVLTADELKELEEKIKARYAKIAEKFFNAVACDEGMRFRRKSRQIQTAYASVYFQYGTKSKTLRAKLVNDDIVGGVYTLLHYTKLMCSVKNKKSTTEVMQFLRRRILEADYLSERLHDEEKVLKVKKMIKMAKQTWKDASGEQL